MQFPLEKKSIDSEQLKSIMKINQRNCPFVKYVDSYTVKFMGKGLTHTDIASVQTQKPVSKDDIIFYFEVRIVEIGQRGDICIGLADAHFPSNKHPGYTKNSYGYKADGKTYTNKLASIQTFRKYNSNDVIGCGLNYLKKEIFFTHNGELQGVPFKNIEMIEFYPTIGIHSANESIKINFEHKFNIEEYRKKEFASTHEEILSLETNSYQIHQIVHSYLYHQGYYRSLECFERISDFSREKILLARNSNQDPLEQKPLNGEKNMDMEEEIKDRKESEEKPQENYSQDAETLILKESEAPIEERTFQKDRDWIRDSVKRGDLEQVLDFLKNQYPQVLSDKSLVLALYVQQFLEFIRRGEISKGIEIAQNAFPTNEEELLDFVDGAGKFIQLRLEDVMGIICYEKPENCPIGYLLDFYQREILADKLNAAILGQLGFSNKSVLEKLLSHFVLINEKNSELNCYLGNLFDCS